MEQESKGLFRSLSVYMQLAAQKAESVLNLNISQSVIIQSPYRHEYLSYSCCSFSDQNYFPFS